MTARLDQDIEHLRSVLAQFADGASLEQVAASANLPVSERTLMRRLAVMVERGIARKTGSSRAARYFPGTAEQNRTAAPSPPAHPDLSAPLSTAASEILRLVKRPLTARRPVSYVRGFLDGYRPNRSSYLTVAEKKRLRNISRTNESAHQPAGTHAQRILTRLLIDLSWNSSRLEGNTYSLLDTERLIEAGEASEGKTSADTQMILNHKAAIEFLVQSAGEIGFNRYTILNLHALLAENLLPDPAAEGRIRRIPVSISKSVYHPPEVPQLLQECFDQILATAEAIADPFEQAFFVMVQLPYLQPFEDVNKRVSRLAANIPLIRRNLSPLSFVDVPEDAYAQGVLGVYELNRVELLKDVFLWAYERSAARYAAIRQSIGEPDTFRLRHRQTLKQVVAEVIRAPMDQRSAARHIAAFAAAQVPGDSTARFIEIAETELLALHEGNFARYQIRPSEYQAWQRTWNRKPKPSKKSATRKNTG